MRIEVKKICLSIFSILLMFNLGGCKSNNIDKDTNKGITYVITSISESEDYVVSDGTKCIACVLQIQNKTGNIVTLNVNDAIKAEREGVEVHMMTPSNKTITINNKYLDESVYYFIVDSSWDYFNINVSIGDSNVTLRVDLDGITETLLTMAKNTEDVITNANSDIDSVDVDKE